MPKIVLITGASSGVGSYAAAEFITRGDVVYGTSRSAETGGRISLPGGKYCPAVRLDVDDLDSCRAAIDAVIKKEGRMDVLVNNAGFGIAGPLELAKDEEIKALFETNFFGAVRMMRLAAERMREQGGGIIVSTSSVAAVIPLPYQAMYSASKAALEAVSQAMNAEVRDFGIKLSCVEFGDMKTGFTGSRIKTEVPESGQNEIYAAGFRRSLSRMERDEQNGPLPVKAAGLIYKVSAKKCPKPVYVCGASYKLIATARRLLPMRLTNWLIAKMYS